MHRSQVSVDVVDETGAPGSLAGRVSDVLTRDGAEYLVVDTAAEGRVSLRLDRIKAIYQASGRIFPCR